MPAPYVTRHAKKRGKERLGIPARALERLVPRVLEEGHPASDYVGRVRRYLDWLHAQHGTANNCRIYGQHVFLFNQQTLITVVHVPASLRSALK